MTISVPAEAALEATTERSVSPGCNRFSPVPLAPTFQPAPNANDPSSTVLMSVIVFSGVELNDPPMSNVPSVAVAVLPPFSIVRTSEASTGRDNKLEIESAKNGKMARAERVSKLEKPEKPARPEKPQKPERPEKPEKPEKPQRPEKPEKPEKPNRR